MAAEYPPRDRLSLRAYIRARLRGRGLLEFADDDEEARSSAELVYLNCGRSWYEDAMSRANLELEALVATTTDVPMQGIENTVRADDEFWSSTGTSTGEAGEALLYRLRQPFGRLAYISLAVYRAFYQHGDPLYPARKVSFLTGPAPNQLYPASPVYPVRLTDEVQVFALSPTAAVSNYLMVRLHGRLQRQWEDLQFYIAIRHVAAYGDPVSSSYGFQLARMVRVSGLAWPCSRGLVAATAVNAWGDRNGCEAKLARAHGSTCSSASSQGPGGGGAGPFGLLAARASVQQQDRVVAEDVYEARPLSALERRRAYVAIAPCRQARRAAAAAAAAGTAPELGPIAAAATAASPARLPAGRPWRPRAVHGVLPSGPTESELRLAVQHGAVLRALPHLVHVPWPAVLVSAGRGGSASAPEPELQPWGGRGSGYDSHWTEQQALQPQPPWQTRRAVHGAAGPAGWGRRSVQAGAGFVRPAAATASVQATAGAGQGWRLNGRAGAAAAAAEVEASSGGSSRRTTTRPGREAAASYTLAQEGEPFGNTAVVVASGRAQAGSGGGGVAGPAAAGLPSGVGPLQRLRQWVVAAARGTAAAVRSADAGSDPDSDAEAEAVFNRFGRLSGRDGTATGADAAAAVTAAGPPGSPAVSTELQLSPDSTTVDVGLGTDHIHSLVLSYLRAHHLAVPPNAAVDWQERRRQLEGLQQLLQQQLRLLQEQQQQRIWQQQQQQAVEEDWQKARLRAGREEAGPGTSTASVAGATAGPHALWHTRPQQPLPPPKLRRRGYGNPAAIGIVSSGIAVKALAAKGVSGRAGVGGRGVGDEVQRLRRRHHLRAAQRAMQPALYDPSKGTALFVALEAWSAYGRSSSGDGSSSAAAKAVAASVDADEQSAACWRVSHYDHEHL